jgi:hypothetical protein
MLRRLTTLTLVALCCAAPAAAQTRIGIRAGASGDPDQFVFGMHVDTSPLIEHLTFRPNVEVGVGDNLTLIGLNVEFAYWVPIRNSRWQVYFPVGPAANIYSFDDGPGRRSDTSVEGGFNIGVGVQHGRGLFTEFKVGVIDSPDVKIVVGWVFR